MNSIEKRAKVILNTEQYNALNHPELVRRLSLSPPSERQYVLRMLIKKSRGEYQIPEELQWCLPLIETSIAYQRNVIGINHSFCYLTIRHGEVTSINDDEWHADGFSMRINHIPEQNYVWTDILPTEYVVKPIDLYNFNPLTQNIHTRIGNEITSDDEIKTLLPKTIYCMDPYVIHRRPSILDKTQRTFIRLSFTPIEINDINNTINPLMPVYSDYDGVEFRNTLK